MTPIDFLAGLHSARRQDFAPLCLKNKPFGYLRRDHIPLLQELGFPLKNKNALLQWQAPPTVAERSQQLAAINAELLARGVIGGWRDELLAVVSPEEAEPLALVERCSAAFWGIRAQGVHLTATCAGKMWLARRSPSKSTEPNKLDQLAAGGVAAGMGIRATLIKEAAEEAGIAAELMRAARPTGVLSYCQASDAGVRRDTIYNFDVELPRDFQPHNGDGEVAEFLLLDWREAWERWREFKANSLAVLLHWRLRQGLLDADDPDYLHYCRLLHSDLWE